MSEEPERVVVTPDMAMAPRELVPVTGGRRSVKRPALQRAMRRYLEAHPDAVVAAIGPARRGWAA